MMMMPNINSSLNHRRQAVCINPEEAANGDLANNFSSFNRPKARKIYI